VDPISFYLGPRTSRLLVESWDDIAAAAAAGVLDETHWVELKEAVPASSRPANLELAKDLASLSVDGGVLIVGIADAKGAAGEVVGTELSGLVSRIAQVASGRVAPPLPVMTDVIDKPDEPGTGLLVVTVPASESAPHMVEDRYWGRDAHGKRALSDGEVRRLLADRQARAAGFTDALRELPARLDPPGLGERGRLYVFLQPGSAAPQPVGDLLAGQHLMQVVVPALGFNPQWGPSYSSINHGVPHPEGLAASSASTDEAITDSEDFFFLLLSDDGAVHVSAPAVRNYGRGPEAPEVVSPGQMLETIHGALAIAGHVAAQHTGYQGLWRTGVFVTRLRGLVPSQAHSHVGFRSYPPFPADEYLATTPTTTREMSEAASAVVERLARRLLRGLNVDQQFLPYDRPADIARRT
jgi:hypothetical protein